ncbi:hypothetical protein AB0L88_01500 [Saccharopolyspora shandongensis]|uniref:effector-associated constant component EACC1 n=1 Tax=Saccharopolyspora shandongensis TaxID=418495 RepID=UPI0034136BD6
MEARIVVNGQNADDEMRALHAWLRQEDELRGKVTPRTMPPAAGHMGAVLDSLAVTLGSGGAVAVLAQSVSVWLKQRHSDITVEVTHGERTVKVTANRVMDAEGLIREVLDGEHDR